MSGAWVGVIGDRVWKFRQTETHLSFQAIPPFPQVHPDSNTSLVKLEAEASSLVIKKEEEAIVDKAVGAKSENQKKKGGRKGKMRKREAGGKIKTEPIQVKQEVPDALSSITASDHSPETKPDSSEPTPEEEAIVQDYFQLSVNLDKLYSQWAKQDKNFAKVSPDFLGVRMLRQDPVENLFAFICSSCNNIPRITSMVEKLCCKYGNFIAEVDGIQHYAFPPPARLAGDDVEQDLRDLGFGYRAKFIQQTGRMLIEEMKEGWLESLRRVPYAEAKAELMRLPGVGAKVADCVCLMSLDHPGAIPVDTHVWQIAQRHYLPGLQQAKSLTDRLYLQIGDHFRSSWGKYAGWAHSVLFAADLRHFKLDKKDSAPAPKYPTEASEPQQSTQKKKARASQKTAKKSKR